MPQNMKSNKKAVEIWEKEGKVSEAAASELKDAFDKMDKVLDKPKLVYSNDQAAKDLKTLSDHIKSQAGKGIDPEIAKNLAENVDRQAKGYKES